MPIANSSRLPLRCKSLEVRFWSKVGPPDAYDCWPWLGTRNTEGYGQIGVYRRNIALAHRVSWELTYGLIPDGLCVCHHCDYPPCVNPNHLFLGTRNDNVQDMVRKGRHKHPPLISNQRGESHYRAKLTEADVVYIRRKYAVGGVMQKQLAKEFRVTCAHISRIVRGCVRRHG